MGIVRIYYVNVSIWIENWLMLLSGEDLHIIFHIFPNATKNAFDMYMQSMDVHGMPIKDSFSSSNHIYNVKSRNRCALEMIPHNYLSFNIIQLCSTTSNSSFLLLISLLAFVSFDALCSETKCSLIYSRTIA